MKNEIVNTVPCNGCTQCCQGDAIYLKKGDNPALYKTTYDDNGRLMLDHKKNLDCIYLDRNKGCTIHDYRPIVCKELDCAILLKLPRAYRKKLVAQGRLSKKIIQAARERVKRDK